MNVSQIVKRGFEIGMIQIESEIQGLAGFLASLRPRNIMEIGTDQGGVFYIFTQIATGIKVSLDLPGGKWGSVNKEEKEQRDRSMTDWSQDVILIRDDSHSVTALDAVRRSLTAPLDFLFIDGDHSLVGVADDYLRYSSFVRPGGWIGFHDIADTDFHRQAGCFVSEFWKKLEGHKIEFHAHDTWGGIGLIQVPRLGETQHTPP